MEPLFELPEVWQAARSEEPAVADRFISAKDMEGGWVLGRRAGTGRARNIPKHQENPQMGAGPPFWQGSIRWRDG